MNVVLYMRYSSDRQTEQSIEGQRRVCEEFCRRNKHIIVDSYIDRATSAYKNTDKRTEFQRMIRDSAKGIFQAVVVYKLDRFARNRYDNATYKAKLKKNGVSVISATENISDTPEGVILESVLEGMAEFYSMELSQKITRGRRETAIKGNSLGGRIPLGYKVENKKLVIDPPGAQIVKEAFELYAAGHTVKRILSIFEEKGYRTATNKPFTKNSFSKLLRNEKYIGVYEYKDIRTEGGVPAIVDKETFNTVSERFHANKSAPGRGKARVDYLLSQKLFCGHCGASMTGDSGTSKSGATHYYYTCATRKKSRKCDKKSLPKDFIEDAVIRDAMEWLTPERIETLADMAVKANREDIESNDVIPAMQEQIKDIDKRIERLTNAMEQLDDPTIAMKRINELSAQKADCVKRLREESGQYIVVEREMVIWFLGRFLNGDINDPAFRRDIIQTLVNSVTVWDEPDGGYKITITYNITDRKTQTFRIPPASSAAPPCSDVAPHRPPKIDKLRQEVVDFYLLPLHYSLFTKNPSVDFGKVISNSE